MRFAAEKRILRLDGFGAGGLDPSVWGGRMGEIR
jgi:hypothetical protein